jgi:hypothetical protein
MDCHYNDNRHDEVVVCVARNCSILAAVESAALQQMQLFDESDLGTIGNYHS